MFSAIISPSFSCSSYSWNELSVCHFYFHNQNNWASFPRRCILDVISSLNTDFFQIWSSVTGFGDIFSWPGNLMSRGKHQFIVKLPKNWIDLCHFFSHWKEALFLLKDSFFTEFPSSYHNKGSNEIKMAFKWKAKWVNTSLTSTIEVLLEKVEHSNTLRTAYVMYFSKTLSLISARHNRKRKFQ